MRSVTPVPLRLIRAGDNDRKKFKDSEIRSLAEGIREHGLMTPITLRPRPDGMFEIVAGERRFRAHQFLRAESIEAFVEDMSDAKASAIMLTENSNRVQLSPIEEAKALKKRIDEGWELTSLATAAAMTEDTIKRRLSLLGLLDIVQQLVDLGEFPIGHAEAMVRLDQQRQQMAYGIFLRSGKGLSLKAFREIVEQLQSEQDQGALFELEEFFLQSVEVQAPIRGKQASTGVPIRADLPPVKTLPTDSTSVVMDRYIRDLQSAGKHAEAAVIGTVYDALVRSNFLRVAPRPLVQQQSNS